MANDDPEEPFSRVSVEEADELIRSGKVHIVDVREPDEYAGGHLPGAKLVPLNRVLSKPSEVIGGDDVLFVCAVGQRSAVAAEMAAAVGYENVYTLEGGTNAWAMSGKPIDR